MTGVLFSFLLPKSCRESRHATVMCCMVSSDNSVYTQIQSRHKDCTQLNNHCKTHKQNNEMQMTTSMCAWKNKQHTDKYTQTHSGTIEPLKKHNDYLICLKHLLIVLQANFKHISQSFCGPAIGFIMCNGANKKKVDREDVNLKCNSSFI